MIEIVIPRHAVPSDPATRLSPLQTAMLDDPTPVRIFSAPTGAGKSYAFQKAMRERGARVLFIVPTRRLAQNIAQGLVADLVDTGWTLDNASERVAIWTSDERQRLQEKEPDLNIGKFRLSQLRDDGGATKRGMMIVATQESVVHLLLGRVPGGDAMDPQSIYDLLRLDHIVFDEFHTIDARGLGLACALAAVTSRIRGGARMTFLSATPIDVKSTLVAFGIDPDAITIKQEEVVTGTVSETHGMRAIHGDVRLRIENGDGILSALEAHETEIRETLSRSDSGRQLVIIYDSVKRLLADTAMLAAFLDRLGVSREERLRINSIDDSAKEGKDDRFTFGSLNDPTQFKVLVATSSVEMGVTFKAGMIVMEPGHDPCSFVQRIGRVARGDLAGAVIVSATPSQMDRLGWLRRICSDLSQNGERLPVNDFIGKVLTATRQRFDTSRIDMDAEDGNFRRMPQIAVWCAALFWTAMEKAEWRSVIRGNFREFRPRKAGRMGGMLNSMLSSPNKSAKQWAETMVEEAKTLRIIMERVCLVEPSGFSKSISWHLYASTQELIDAPSVVDEERQVLRVNVFRPISEIEIALGGLRVQRREEAALPHRQGTIMVDGDRMAEQWTREMEKELQRPGLSQADRDAINTALKIVRLTGIVPVSESFSSVGNAIF